jgi:acyl dehydratase
MRFADVEVGHDLPETKPDVSMEKVRIFCRAAGNYTPRFTDHEGARKQGLESAIVPGIMSQALLAADIHHWAPGAQILSIDTVFRAPIPVDSHPLLKSVVTDADPETEIVEIDLTILNEAGETRVMGTARVRLKD